MKSGKRDEPGSVASTGVLLSVAARRLRQELRPLEWLVLEELALGAVVEDGRLVAHISARRLADQIGLDPGTVEKALRALRRKSLVAHERQARRSGRFGTGVYVIQRIDGLEVLSTGPVMTAAAPPGMAPPHTAPPVTAEPAEDDLLGTQPCMADPCTAGSSQHESNRAEQPTWPSRQDADSEPQQVTLNLDSGTL